MPYLTSVVGIPIDSTGKPTGCERAPSVLREHGLITALGIPDLGDLPVTLDDATRDAQSGLIAFPQIISTSETIRAALGDLLRSGERPLVIGGCCTLLIGVTAALRDVHGRAGLAFVDGHIDHYDGQTSPSGEAADTELAILTGHGPEALTHLTGESPLIYPSDVTAIGVRDLAAAQADGAPAPHPAIRIFEFSETDTAESLADLGKQTASRFAADPGRFWLHLDLDVLSVEALSAVDYHMTGGYNWKQLERLIRPLVQSSALLGMDITIYNPNLDPSGEHADAIVNFLASVLA